MLCIIRTEILEFIVAAKFNICSTVNTVHVDQKLKFM